MGVEFHAAYLNNPLPVCEVTFIYFFCPNLTRVTDAICVFRSQHMDLEASFCMETGQVKTGEDKNDTFIKMLQEIVRVTAPVAYGIAAEYPDVPSLMNGFKEHGVTALQDLKVSNCA
jgi:hypothetical protein